MAEDVAAEYAQYLQRFDAQVGEAEPGAFAKFRGRLIRKLDLDEFTTRWGEYHELAGHYFQSIDRGDTINDMVVRLLRDHAATLVLTSPV
jgi:hypothetical protein